LLQTFSTGLIKIILKIELRRLISKKMCKSMIIAIKDSFTLAVYVCFFQISFSFRRVYLVPISKVIKTKIKRDVVHASGLVMKCWKLDFNQDLHFLGSIVKSILTV